MHALLRGTAAMKLRDKLLPCVILKTTKCSDTESSMKKFHNMLWNSVKYWKTTAVNIAFKLTNAGYYKHYKQFCVEKLQQHCKCSPFQLCLNATSSAWKKYLGISIEPPIPKLFIYLFTLFFYSSFYFFSWEGSTVGGGLNTLKGMERFQVSREKEKSQRGMWIIDQRGERESGRESKGENDGDIKGVSKRVVNRGKEKLIKEPSHILEETREIYRSEEGWILFWKGNLDRKKHICKSHASVHASSNPSASPSIYPSVPLSFHLHPVFIVVRSCCIRQRFIFYWDGELL